mgnify:CR=1 FL=1
MASTVYGKPRGCLGLTECCTLWCLVSVCTIAFMLLHAHNADGDTARPWPVVFAPLMLAAAAMLVAAIATPRALCSADRLSLHDSVSVGFGSLALLAVCARLAIASPPPGSPTASGEVDPPVPSFLGWAPVLSPLAALLLLRAATSLWPCPPPLDGEGAAIRAWAASAVPSCVSAVLELLLAGGSLALLYARLVFEAPLGW